MLEKLITGRYIELDIKVLNAKPPAAAAKPPHGSFIDSTIMPLNLQQSVSERTGIFSSNKTSGVAPGVNNAKVHRNFNWLKWVPPYIAQMQLGGFDVLTGPMSGCWVITYRWPGAPTDPVYVGHVGTCGTKEWDDGVKAGWNQFSTNNPAALISGFNPYREFYPNDLGNSPGEYTVIYALVTPERRYYAVKLGQVGPGGTKYRIVKVKEATPTVGEALQRIFA